MIPYHKNHVADVSTESSSAWVLPLCFAEKVSESTTYLPFPGVYVE